MCIRDRWQGADGRDSRGLTLRETPLSVSRAPRGDPGAGWDSTLLQPGRSGLAVYLPGPIGLAVLSAGRLAAAPPCSGFRGMKPEHLVRLAPGESWSRQEGK